MKINASKNSKIYIKNVYVNQMFKPQKQANTNNVYSEKAKNNMDYNINKSVNFNPKKIFFTKKEIRTLYQNCYPNKSCLIQCNQNYMSQKNIHNKSYKNYGEKPSSLGIFSESIISGRKVKPKKYEIVNPFKERSNSENKINCFNRTYTFFNNKDNNNKKSYIKAKVIDKNKGPGKSVEKISINLNDISYQNLPTDIYDTNISKDNNKDSISPIKGMTNYKKYFYQEKPVKNNLEKNRNTSFSKLNKKSINIMTPLLRKNFSTKSITSPNSKSNNGKMKTKNDKNGRIKKYILNNLSDKRKLKSRQYFRHYLAPFSKSTDINNVNCMNCDNNINNMNNNSPERNDEENKLHENISVLNSPSIPSYSSLAEDNINNSIKRNKKCIWTKNSKYLLYKNKENVNKNINNRKQNYNKNGGIINLRNKLNCNLPLVGFYSNTNNKIKGMKDDLFEQSAIIIQSVFRGFRVKVKFEAFLYNCKNYNRGLEILIQIFNSFLDRNINIIQEKKEFINYLIFFDRQKLFRNKSNINFKSCKTFKLLNMPSSPISEKEGKNTKQFMDLFLHKEIGERFNIIKQNKNKEKEIEEKYKEELDGVNNKMNKLIEENNKLKDINNQNKLKEIKFKELSLDNKKKDNIINIITNDNQNLAKKLKIIKDKYNKLEIKRQIDINYNPENNENNNREDLLNEYRNLYLLFLIHKKNVYILDIMRKYFNKYRNTIIFIVNNNNQNNLLMKQKLKFFLWNKANKEYNLLKNKFMTFYFKGLINQKENENLNNIRTNKLERIILNKEKANQGYIKSYFQKFYYRGIIANLIEEKNEYIEEKNQENTKKIKKLFISIENKKNKYNFLKIKASFRQWHLLSKLLGMKAITDEKKRKKRQKQRMKKKIENKSVNKYLTNSHNILNLGKNNNINIIDKEKDLICSVHSVTTDFSGGEINLENKIDKIMKATDKLGKIFYKAATKFKILENKNKTENERKEMNSNLNSQIIEKKDKKENDENENEYDEDSGDSFGIE